MLVLAAVRVRLAIAIAAGAILTSACGSSSQKQSITSPTAGTKCAVRIEGQNPAFPPAGGSGAVTVSTNRECAWTGSTDAPWVTLSATAGQGDGSIQFTVASNADPTSRTASITVNDQRLPIAQEGRPCEFRLSSSQEAVDAAGGERAVQVRTSAAACTWKATANVAWITIVSGREGRGDGTVTFRIDALDGPPRSGTINVAGHVMTVQQSAGCTFSLTPANVNAGAAGATVNFQVETAAGCTWSAATDVAWLTVTGPRDGSGRHQVEVAVAANPGAARRGSVVVAGQHSTVTQASGCTYGVSPPEQQVAPGGGTATVSVSTAPGCTWTTTSGVDWIAVAAPSGSGPGQAAFTVARNDGPRRTGTVTVAGGSHTVNQASSCVWIFGPPSLDFPASGGFGSVLVVPTGPCTWTATSTVDWLGVTAGASGVGGGLLQFTVAPNPGAARTGIILVGGERYRVTQGGR